MLIRFRRFNSTVFSSAVSRWCVRRRPSSRSSTVDKKKTAISRHCFWTLWRASTTWRLQSLWCVGETRSDGDRLDDLRRTFAGHPPGLHRVHRQATHELFQWRLLMSSDLLFRLVQGALTGVLAAAAVDVQAFRAWRSLDDAVAYDWRLAAL